MNSATLFSDDLVQAVSVQEHHGGDREPVMRCGDVFLATAALGCLLYTSDAADE